MFWALSSPKYSVELRQLYFFDGLSRKFKTPYETIRHINFFSFVQATLLAAFLASIF